MMPTKKPQAKQSASTKTAPPPKAKASAQGPAKGSAQASAQKKAPKTAQKAPKPPTQRAKKTRQPKPLPPEEVFEVFRRFQAIEPEPKGELEHVNAFTLLVAVVLSAQATDAGVNKATRALFQIADTPEKMVALGEDTIRDYIKTIGLYRNKAKNVFLLSQALIAQHGSTVPRDRDALEQLPGVGRKTANVVLNMAFGEHTIAVDTHLFRVSNRIPLAPGKTPLAVELGLLKIVPPQFGLHAHHWLILHGRYICKARKPECWRCPINDLCRFEPKIKGP